MLLIKRFRQLLQMSALRQAVQLTFVFLVIVCVAGAVSIVFVDREITARIDVELEGRAGDLALRLATTGPDRSTFFETEDRFALYADQGSRLSRFLRGRVGKLPGAATVMFKEEEGPGELEGAWRVYVLPVSGGLIVVGSNLEDREDYLEVLINIFAVSGGATLAVMLVAGGLLGWRAQKRVSSITGVLDKVAAGDLSARVGDDVGKDDFGRLARSLDETTARLEILMRQTRNLTTNIAHDLKTPLTRLRAELEGLEHEFGEQEAIENALEQTDEVISIFESLLRMAKLESGEHRQRFETLALASVAEDVADIYRAVIEDSGRGFQLHVSQPANVQGDRRLIIQALANLIENSLKHTPAETQIGLEVHGRTLVFTDTGPGIPEDLRDRVFEPMFRLEESRTTPGAGLGLALFQAIANLHQAEVLLSENPQADTASPGLRIEIRFP